MVISEIMTNAPTTAQPTATVAEAIGTMRELDIRHLPIVEAGELVGIVSDRDLRSFTEWYLVSDERQESLRKKLGTALADVMNTDLAAVSPEGELAEAIDIMLEERVGAVPVVDERDRKLVGIVSYVDALRALRPLA